MQKKYFKQIILFTAISILTFGAFGVSANNPVPIISSMIYDYTIVGGPSFQLWITSDQALISGFVQGSFITFNGVILDSTLYTDYAIHAIVPRSAISNAGTFNVTVTNPDPGGGISNVVKFTVNNPYPSIVDIVPSSSTVGNSPFDFLVNGYPATELGYGFVQTSVITFNGVAYSTTYISPTQLKLAFQINPTVAGTYFIAVVNPGPGGGTSESYPFHIYNPEPVITSISPSTTPIQPDNGPGVIVTVNGTGFLDANRSTVNFNGSSRETTYVSPTILTARILFGDLESAGTFQITVFNPSTATGGVGLGDGVSNPKDFIVTEFGTITVNKVLIPSSDPGRFDLTMNGQIIAENVGDRGSGGAQNLAAGLYTFYETAEIGTNLSDYITIVTGQGCEGGGIQENPGTFTLAAGENKICTITNTRISTTQGYVRIIKYTSPGSSQTIFNFNVNRLRDGIPVSDTNLLVSVNANQLLEPSGGYTNEDTTRLINAGTYSVSETIPTDWQLDYGFCTLQDGTVTDYADANGLINGVTIIVGQTTTCTFTNTYTGTPPLTGQGKLKVIKIARNGIGADIFYYNIYPTVSTLSISNVPPNNSSQIDSLPVGKYAIIEYVPLDWDWTFNTASCVIEGIVGTSSVPTGLIAPNGRTDVEIKPGQTTTCTFENTYIGPTNVGWIQVVKNTIGVPVETFGFTDNIDLYSLTTVATSPTAGTKVWTSAGLAPSNPANSSTTYSIVETDTVDWRLTSFSCILKNGNPAGGTVLANGFSNIRVNAGETTTCTFTNTYTAPSTSQGTIRIIKNAMGGVGNQTFNFITNFGALSYAIPTVGNVNGIPAETPLISVTAGGGFSVSETVTLGWALGNNSGCQYKDGTFAGPMNGFSVRAGETTTCTFTNIAGTHSVMVMASGAENVLIDSNNNAWSNQTDYVTPPVPTGTFVSLTAPAITRGIYGPAYFSHWLGDCDIVHGTTCDNTMNTSRRANAFYNTTNTNTLSVNSSGATYVLITSSNDNAWGGHTNYRITDIATGTLVSLTAPDISGFLGTSTFSHWVGCSSENGRTCSVTMNSSIGVTAVYIGEQGTLNIIKTTIGGPGGDVTFTFDVGETVPVYQVTVATSDCPDCPGQGNISMAIDPGIYTVYEIMLVGWTVTEEMSCVIDTNTSAGMVVFQAGQVVIQAGKTTTCTILNTYTGTPVQPGTLKIVKTTIGGPGGDVTFNFEMGETVPVYQVTVATSDCPDCPGQGNQSKTLDPGTYSVTEATLADWEPGVVSCDNGSTPGSIVIEAGRTTTCTFENTYIPDSCPETPQIDSISPTSKDEGSTGFTLTVTGTGFMSNSEIRFNGELKGTEYISATELTAFIFSQDIEWTGIYSVEVVNPAETSGTEDDSICDDEPSLGEFIVKSTKQSPIDNTPDAPFIRPTEPVN